MVVVVGSWVLHERVFLQLPPCPEGQPLAQARWDPSGLKDLSLRRPKPILARKVQKHLPALGSTSLDRDLFPLCHRAAERQPWGSTTIIGSHNHSSKQLPTPSETPWRCYTPRVFGSVFPPGGLR